MYVNNIVSKLYNDGSFNKMENKIPAQIENLLNMANNNLSELVSQFEVPNEIKADINNFIVQQKSGIYTKSGPEKNN